MIDGFQAGVQLNSTTTLFIVASATSVADSLTVSTPWNGISKQSTLTIVAAATDNSGVMGLSDNISTQFTLALVMCVAVNS